MLVDIPFQPKWQHKMLVGLKTCTSRTKRYGHTGDTFRHFGKTFIMLSIEKRTLKNIADNLYTQEGCDSQEEFKEVWIELHPRKGWVPNQKVFVHFFEKV